MNVWLGMTANKIYGPFTFAEPTVTGMTYLDMLEFFLAPQLVQDGIVETVIFQQDGAPPHFALTVQDFLNGIFPNRWIGRGSQRLWASRSPDLTPLDFFVWGFIKSKVYATKVNNLQDLKQRIWVAAALITPAMMRQVFRETKECWQTCFELQGGHIEMY